MRVFALSFEPNYFANDNGPNNFLFIIATIMKFEQKAIDTHTHRDTHIDIC